MGSPPDYTEPSTLPFVLTLPEAGPAGMELRCEESLRARPGKRLVCKARWGELQVVVKIFAPGPRARSHWDRERHGLEALSNNGVPTPKFLYAGPLPQRQGFLLVSLFMVGSDTLKGALAKATGIQDRRRLKRELVRVIARQHQAGLVHKDPHLDNFLVTKDGLLTLDGGDIEIKSKSLNLQDSLTNLGLVLAQFPLDQEPDVLGLFPAYAAIRDWDIDAAVWRLLARDTASARQHRGRNYQKKIMRDCTAFLLQHDFQHRLVCRRSAYHGELLELLDDPDRYLERHHERFLKQGNSSTVTLIRIDGHPMAVKRYNLKNPLHAMSRAIRRTRAERSWKNAHILEHNGIPTTRPIAMLERRFGPLRGTSFFISEYADGESGREFFAERRLGEGNLPTMAGNLVKILARLANLRICHGDMKATNFIITADGPIVTDLDAMQVYRTQRGYRSALARDHRRFMANWQDVPPIMEMFEQAMEKQFSHYI
ncbi:MAG: hypothetical protein GY731_00240 [Gammaproteobacteria bacterium]|nr:hypothetical protein [Gammaproteobacteria bacterium]